MKRFYLTIVYVAISAMVILTSCGGSKKMSNGQSASIDQQIEEKKKQIELDEVNAEAEIKKKKQEMRMKEVEDEAALRKEKTRRPVKGEQRTFIYCMDEAFDKPGEYMGGLGVVEARPDRNRAILDANRAAIAEIATRYVGIIKNAIEDYTKDMNVPSGKKIYESLLEGGAGVIGSKVIDKYANVVCREVTQEATGGWVGYVAVHVLLDDVKKGLADELEERKVEYDKKKFFEKMDAELKVNGETHNSGLKVEFDIQ
jgi:hypothetical protein